MFASCSFPSITFALCFVFPFNYAHQIELSFESTHNHKRRLMGTCTNHQKGGSLSSINKLKIGSPKTSFIYNKSYPPNLWCWIIVNELHLVAIWWNSTLMLKKCTGNSMSDSNCLLKSTEEGSTKEFYIDEIFQVGGLVGPCDCWWGAIIFVSVYRCSWIAGDLYTKSHLHGLVILFYFKHFTFILTEYTYSFILVTPRHPHLHQLKNNQETIWE